MKPVALGMDLVEIARVRRIIDRYGERVLRRLLTGEERAYCAGMAAPEQHVATRIAAKEAAYKALQQADSARAVGWLEIEVVLNADGRPDLRFHGRALDAVCRLDVGAALVSLTHTKDTAGAVVVLVRNP